MDDSSLEISLKDATSNHSDYSNYFDYSNYSDYSNHSDYSYDFNYFNYGDYFNYFNYGDYFNYFNYFNYGDYFNYFNYFNYGDYFNYGNYFNYFNYGNYFNYFNYGDYFDYFNYGDYFDYFNYFNYGDYFNYFNYGDYFNYYYDQSSSSVSNNSNSSFSFDRLFGGSIGGEAAVLQFVVTCLLISVGLPLTLGAIYALYSQVRNGEVAPIYVINLLISDLVQLCCMIVEVAQPKDPKIVFKKIYLSSVLASVGFMVCIALERYLVVVHPLWYHFRRTIKSSVLVCVLVWILPVVCVLTQHFSSNHSVFSVIFTVFFLLPLPLLVFFLVATIRALSASISVPSDKKRRIAVMLVLVLLIYTLLFLPTIIRVAYKYAPDKPRLDSLSDLVPVFLKMSPLADLVLYILIREGTIRQLWAFVCRCRKDNNNITTVPV